MAGTQAEMNSVLFVGSGCTVLCTVNKEASMFARFTRLIMCWLLPRRMLSSKVPSGHVCLLCPALFFKKANTYHL